MTEKQKLLKLSKDVYLFHIRKILSGGDLQKTYPAIKIPKNKEIFIDCMANQYYTKMLNDNLKKELAEGFL